MKNFLQFFLTFYSTLVLAAVNSEPVMAGRECDVSEIVDMVDNDYRSTEIRERCERVDVEGCSVRKVIRLAEDGESVRKIYSLCE